MKQLSLIVGIFLGSLLLQYCSDGTTTTLSSLGLTGTFRYTDTSAATSHCRGLENLSYLGDNLSQKYTVVISDTAITVTNSLYDNTSSGTLGTWCDDANKLYTVSQTYNVVSVGAASTATAFDNDSTVAQTSTLHNADNYTTRLLTGTVGATTVTCYDEQGNVAANRGCQLLKAQRFCGLGDNSWDNATAYTVNGSGRCYVADNNSDGTVSYWDNLTKMAGIMLDNDTLQVPVSGTTKYLTLGYFDNSTSVRHISFREFNGPNTLAGAASTTDYGSQTHTAFYFTGSTAQDNITAYWGGSDNLSNLLVPVS